MFILPCNTVFACKDVRSYEIGSILEKYNSRRGVREPQAWQMRRSEGEFSPRAQSVAGGCWENCEFLEVFGENVHLKVQLGTRPVAM